jgi:hypothetical protein
LSIVGVRAAVRRTVSDPAISADRLRRISLMIPCPISLGHFCMGGKVRRA